MISGIFSLWNCRKYGKEVVSRRAGNGMEVTSVGIRGGKSSLFFLDIFSSTYSSITS